MLINLLGLMLIALIVWWFWLYKPNKTIVQGNEVLIEVRDGVYSPFPSLDISEQLKLNEITQITLLNLSPGEHEFHCQMQMYRGVLKVV